MNRKNKTILFIALPFVVLGLLITVYYLNKPGNLRNQSGEFQISSMDLNREFINNDSLATLKYSNKVIELRGAVANIRNSETHGTIITMDDPMMGVKCVMDSTVKEISVSIGDTVTVKGICVGSDRLIGVLMNQCIIAGNK